jgi:carboxypeptidase Taq
MSQFDSSYARLTARLRHLQVLESVGEHLSWDEQVNLPAGAAAQRGEQMEALAEVAHAAASARALGQDVAQLAGAADLSADQRVVVTLAQRDFARATKLPAEFVREKAALSSHGYHVWAQARAASDFTAFAPIIEGHLELARREAAYLGQAAAPYDCFLDQHDPGMTAAVVEGLFAELEAGLVPLGRALAAAPAPARRGPQAATETAQREFCREVTTRMGFDYNRGRLDTSLHPFCSGTGDDVRLTMRFLATDPLSALFAAIHEAGHGLYEQGLPAAARGTALGRHAGMAVHESQSRLWENFVGRSLGFWRYFAPRLGAVGTEAATAEDIYRTVNRVRPTLIRVEADDVTYNLHIILRFQLEQRLFAGTLAVADLPAAWNARSRALLGLDPPSDREGVLQDVHWSGGAFGYFPSYCLGNMIAAQLWEQLLGLRPELEEDFARGDFAWLLGWLRSHVHAAARRHDPLTLVRLLTGRELSPQPLLRYLKLKYQKLYGLGA